MAIGKDLDNILNTKSKVKIIRLFASRTDDFIAAGREIAKLIGVSPPAAHSALKELYGQCVLRREIIGKQHIYRINFSSRLVKNILRPMFKSECLIKEDIKDFLLKKIQDHKIRFLIISLILYGSVAEGKTRQGSDCDIAVVVKDSFAKKQIEGVFLDKISEEFYQYFGFSLDAYIKTLKEFKGRIAKKLPPVSSLMKYYIVIYGKDPRDYK